MSDTKRIVISVDKTSATGFWILGSDNRQIEAKDMQEVVYALEHRFQTGAPGYSGDIPNAKFDMEEHRQHSAECGCCPLCRAKSD